MPITSSLSRKKVLVIAIKNQSFLVLSNFAWLFYFWQNILSNVVECYLTLKVTLSHFLNKKSCKGVFRPKGHKMKFLKFYEKLSLKLFWVRVAWWIKIDLNYFLEKYLVLTLKFHEKSLHGTLLIFCMRLQQYNAVKQIKNRMRNTKKIDLLNSFLMTSINDPSLETKVKAVRKYEYMNHCINKSPVAWKDIYSSANYCWRKHYTINMQY